MGARYAECKSAGLLVVVLFPVLALSLGGAAFSVLHCSSLLCFAAAWGDPSRSGRMQTLLLPSPQHPAQQMELPRGVHPRDQLPQALEKGISKSPGFLCEDSPSLTLTVTGRTFNFGNEYALMEGWTDYIMNTISCYRLTNICTIIAPSVWKLPNWNILCHYLGPSPPLCTKDTATNFNFTLWLTFTGIKSPFLSCSFTKYFCFTPHFWRICDLQISPFPLLFFSTQPFCNWSK